VLLGNYEVHGTVQSQLDYCIRHTNECHREDSFIALFIFIACFESNENELTETEREEPNSEYIAPHSDLIKHQTKHGSQTYKDYEGDSYYCAGFLKVQVELGLEHLGGVCDKGSYNHLLKETEDADYPEVTLELFNIRALDIFLQVHILFNFLSSFCNLVLFIFITLE